MNKIEDIKRNNFVIALSGMNFITPFFRMIAGQEPNEVEVYTITGNDDDKKSKKLKKIWQKRKTESFVVVIRDEKANLEDVFFVPSNDKKELVRKLVSHNPAA